MNPIRCIESNLPKFSNSFVINEKLPYKNNDLIYGPPKLRINFHTSQAQIFKLMPQELTLISYWWKAELIEKYLPETENIEFRISIVLIFSVSSCHWRHVYTQIPIGVIVILSWTNLVILKLRFESWGLNF